MLERYLIFWLSASSLLAYLWPRLAPGVGDPFLSSAPVLNYLFAVAMFAIGWLLPRDEVRNLARRWPSVLGGTAIQYATMPLLAYGLGLAFRLDPISMAGIVFVGCVPGAMASNVLTLAARGHVSYSVSLTTSATLLSPLIVPVALKWFLGAEADFPAARESWKLCWMVVIPVVTGHALSRFLPAVQLVLRPVCTSVANLVILWIIAVVVALNRDTLVDVQPRVLAALATLNLCGYLAGYAGSRLMRLPTGMQRALTLEVGMQNAGLGTTLALGLFVGQEAVALPPAMYTFGCMLTGTILARSWATWQTRPTPRCDGRESIPVEQEKS